MCFVWFYRYCHVISVVFNFGYLAFFRMAAYFGYAEVSTGTPNAVQLILSLKVRHLIFYEILNHK